MKKSKVAFLISVQSCTSAIIPSLKFESLIDSKLCMCCSTSFQKCTLWHFHEKFVSFSKSPKCVKVYKWLFQTLTLVNYVAWKCIKSKLIYNNRFVFLLIIFAHSWKAAFSLTKQVLVKNQFQRKNELVNSTKLRIWGGPWICKFSILLGFFCV